MEDALPSGERLCYCVLARPLFLLFLMASGGGIDLGVDDRLRPVDARGMHYLTFGASFWAWGEKVPYAQCHLLCSRHRVLLKGLGDSNELGNLIDALGHIVF